MTTEREQYILHLEALPGEVPAVIRLRRLLKLLLRTFGIRCVKAYYAKDATPELLASSGGAVELAIAQGDPV